MTPQEKADVEAREAGIETLAMVRDEAIASRDTALAMGAMHGAVYLSHIIWWLTKAQELLAQSDQT